MSVWSKQEHDVDREQGSPDIRVEVDARVGAAGSASRTQDTGEDTRTAIAQILSSNQA